MSLFSQDIYNETLKIAAHLHGDQLTPGGHPYVVHLASVAMEVMAAIAPEGLTLAEADLAIQCALLHDTLEDTDAAEDQLRDQFHLSEDVIAGVKALTKDETLPEKRAMMTDSLERLLRQPRTVQMVKLADRITNMFAPPAHWTVEKAAAYRDEAEQIRAALAPASAFLAERLKGKIDAYAQYL